MDVCIPRTNLGAADRVSGLAATAKTYWLGRRTRLINSLFRGPVTSGCRDPGAENYPSLTANSAMTAAPAGIDRPDGASLDLQPLFAERRRYRFARALMPHPGETV